MRSSSAAALEALQQGSWRTSGSSRWLGWLPILGRLFQDGPRRADALNVMMLTGDNVASARSIAGAQAGMAHARFLPVVDWMAAIACLVTVQAIQCMVQAIATVSHSQG